VGEPGAGMEGGPNPVSTVAGQAGNPATPPLASALRFLMSLFFFVLLVPSSSSLSEEMAMGHGTLRAVIGRFRTRISFLILILIP
jgi:hypothetical protein